MVDEGVCDFLLQLCNEIIQIQRTQVFCFAAHGHFVFLLLFIADNDLIREAVLAVITDFVADFFRYANPALHGSLRLAIWQPLHGSNLLDFR